MIKDLIHAPEEEAGKEKHVPFIEKLEGGVVRVTCGEKVRHPSTEQHYIQWIKLFGTDKEGKFRELGSATLTPVYAQPQASFTVNIENYSELQALIYCNLHGLWQNSLKL